MQTIKGRLDGETHILVTDKAEVLAAFADMMDTTEYVA